MKCMIFCCLLAFCAIEIALADQPSDLNNLYIQSVKQIEVFKAAKEKEIQALIDAGNQKKKDTRVCETNFKVPLINTVNSGEKLLWNCVNGGTQNKNLKSAQSCTGKQVATSIREIQFIVDTIKKCIDEKVNK